MLSVDHPDRSFLTVRITYKKECRKDDNPPVRYTSIELKTRCHLESFLIGNEVRSPKLLDALVCQAKCSILNWIPVHVKCPIRIFWRNDEIDSDRKSCNICCISGIHAFDLSACFGCGGNRFRSGLESPGPQLWPALLCC